jgi:lactate dehydrogenase-like 2-hydroxyacid dehydrogenase
LRPVALQLCPLSARLEEGLARRFEVVRWDRFDEMARRGWLATEAASAQAVVTGGHLGCDNALMAALPALDIIAINGVGFDKVDLDFAKSRSVSVTTTPDVLTDDVADLAVGLTIGLLRAIPAGDAFVRSRGWLNGEVPLARSVAGRRFGILGLGRIGAAIASRLAAFGPVAYSEPEAKDVDYDYHPDAHSLAGACDVFIVACAANAATYKMVDAAVLAALGPQSYLVNVSRGSVVDEDALIAALEAGDIAGAALDVFADEPRVPERLLASKRTVLTPHIASATHETRAAMADLVLANLDAYLAGEPLPTAIV